LGILPTTTIADWSKQIPDIRIYLRTKHKRPGADQMPDDDGGIRANSREIARAMMSKSQGAEEFDHSGSIDAWTPKWFAHFESKASHFGSSHDTRILPIQRPALFLRGSALNKINFNQ